MCGGLAKRRASNRPERAEVSFCLDSLLYFLIKEKVKRDKMSSNVPVILINEINLMAMDNYRELKAPSKKKL